MKFRVSGTILGKTNFNLEIEAPNEKVASKIAINAIGSSQKLKNSMIKVNEIKEIK
ncbi:MAG: hypothetical protein QXD11_02320 [Candidatus Micrarchaeaceae archaeon]